MVDEQAEPGSVPADPFGPETTVWATLRIHYDASIAAGFTPEQGTYLVGEMLKQIVAGAQARPSE